MDNFLNFTFNSEIEKRKDIKEESIFFQKKDKDKIIKEEQNSRDIEIPSNINITLEERKIVSEIQNKKMSEDLHHKIENQKITEIANSSIMEVKNNSNSQKEIVQFGKFEDHVTKVNELREEVNKK